MDHFGTNTTLFSLISLSCVLNFGDGFDDDGEETLLRAKYEIEANFFKFYIDTTCIL